MIHSFSQQIIFNPKLRFFESNSNARWANNLIKASMLFIVLQSTINTSFRFIWQCNAHLEYTKYNSYMEIISYTWTFLILIIVTIFLWRYLRSNLRKTQTQNTSLKLVCGMFFFAISMIYRAIYNIVLLQVESKNGINNAPCWMNQNK